MPAMKTPGVYIVEKNAFPNSVVEVATAVPAFIGYTEKADNKGKSLHNTPWRISSMAEFRTYFGGPPPLLFKVEQLPAKQLAGSRSSRETPALEAPASTSRDSSGGVAAGSGAATETTASSPGGGSGATASSSDGGASAEGTGESSSSSGASGSTPEAGVTTSPSVSGLSASTASATTTTTAPRVTPQVVVAGSTTAVQPSGGAAVAAAPARARVAQDLEKAFTVNGSDYAVTPVQQAKERYLLYHSMLLFFQNGGGPCYIVSVGAFDTPIDKDELSDAIGLLLKEQEPTMVVIPDAVRLDKEECTAVQQAALAHCAKTQSRFAILDIHDGHKDRKDPSGDPVANFRDSVGINDLHYGAAYYPWLNTVLVGDKDLNYQNFDAASLGALLTQEGAMEQVRNEVAKLSKFTPDLLHKALIATSPAFAQAMTEMKRQVNLLPPAAAMAGVYSKVDGTAGVWKAPANVSLNSVTSPTVNISADDQEDLNVHVQGKSVNAIRSFIGEGILVWGARTLDGNSLDWRYISVRRTMIMLEQSIKLATKAYVFENNVSSTWVTITSMIRNFLTGIWKRGGLAGATPDEAFAVFCGLGETMTPEDILEGILRVTVLVAVTRPAEFIEITFQQQLQKS